MSKTQVTFGFTDKNGWLPKVLNCEGAIVDCVLRLFLRNIKNPRVEFRNLAQDQARITAQLIRDLRFFYFREQDQVIFDPGSIYLFEMQSKDHKSVISIATRHKRNYFATHVTKKKKNCCTNYCAALYISFYTV